MCTACTTSWQTGLSDHVTFLGFVSGEEKRQVLREAWAYARPSHQEHVGVAVLEAIAANLPVVLSAELQLRAFVEAKDLGVIVERTDPGSIAEGLRAVLDDVTRRERVAEQGPAAVQETFSLKRVGELGAIPLRAGPRCCPIVPLLFPTPLLRGAQFGVMPWLTGLEPFRRPAWPSFGWPSRCGTRRSLHQCLTRLLLSGRTFRGGGVVCAPVGLSPAT